MILRWMYLGLAIFGAAQSIMWYIANGFDICAMIGSGPTVIGMIAVIVWVLAEVYARKDYWVAPIAIAATVGLGISCGLPLYLYLRTRPIL